MSDDMTETLVAIARLEGKLDVAIQAQQDHLKQDGLIHGELKKLAEDHEHRVRSLEKSTATNKGIAAGISAVISGAGALIMYFTKGGA